MLLDGRRKFLHFLNKVSDPSHKKTKAPEPVPTKH